MANDDAVEQEDPLERALLNARKFVVDLGRHLDRAAEERDVAELARAWVRAVQLERVLRDALPPEVTAEARPQAEAATSEARPNETPRTTPRRDASTRQGEADG